MGADCRRASSSSRDRPRGRGCGEGQSRPVEGYEGARFLIEREGGALTRRASMRRYEGLSRRPVRRWRSGLGAESEMDVRAPRCAATWTAVFKLAGCKSQSSRTKSDL